MTNARADKLVIQRFEDLLAKAKEVNDTKRGGNGEETVDSEKFYEWATSALSLLRNVYGQNSDHYCNFKTWYDKFGYCSYEFENCRGIFNGAKQDYEKGYSLKLRSLINAEILDDLLEQTAELLKANYKDAACVIGRVALENALKDLSDRNDIEKSKLNKMNDNLYKAQRYNLGLKKQITAWADRGNNAAHGNFNEYNKEDVNEMIKGIRRFIAEHL